MIVQITGLPGTGKTHLIKKYLEQNSDKEITYIDIADKKFNYPKSIRAIKGKLFIKEVYEAEAKGNVIAESACGETIRGSEIIRLKINETDRVKQYKERENSRLKQDDRPVDKNRFHSHLTDVDIRHLEDCSMPPSYTVTTQQAFFDILDTLFKKR